MFDINIFKKQITEQSWGNEINFTEIYGYNCLEIPSDKVLDICAFLKQEQSLDQLIDIVGVDRFTKKERFELIYNLSSNAQNVRIFLKTKLDSESPEIDSITPVWTGANWMEREVYDMFGIVFGNHPDLRRIYMMDDYEYYPLRKDYPLMGIPGAVELPKK
jgi:NADH-quinone oxidoreductase subunit C